MEIGLMHAHKGVAYLIFVFAFINMVIVLMPNKNTPAIAKIMKIVHMVVLNLGRTVLLLGIAVYALKYATVPVMRMWWAWSALLLWGPFEVVAKRLVKKEIECIFEGGEASSKLVIGAIVELLLVAVIFYLMSVKP